MAAPATIGAFTYRVERGGLVTAHCRVCGAGWVVESLARLRATHSQHPCRVEAPPPRRVPSDQLGLFINGEGGTAR